MNKIPSALTLGIRRGGLEMRQFARQRESVVFTLLFPVILLAIFGSVFKDTIAPGVTFSQYFVAGMIASGLVNTGFQSPAITIPMERDVGGLKRLRGTPMPASSYFIGKAILIAVSMIIQLALLFGSDIHDCIASFNAHSPQFVVSCLSQDQKDHDLVWRECNAPFVGNGFTRWVDGQYALKRPELGLSNWQGGRLLGRGGVLSGDGVHTVRLRAQQTDTGVHR
jgi:hypothetical protein